jgi:hypothetical protein
MAIPRGGGVKIFSASRADLWRYAGWAAVAIAVVLYYGRYSKTPVNLVVYALGAECLWNGQPFHQCAPEFTYPPAVALLMLPFVPLSPELRLLVWYVISIAATIGCVGLCEALVRKLYPTAADEPQLVWVRLLTILFILKFILVVLNYQAYDLIVLCVILLGLWTLITRRPIAAGGLLALAAAVKATPLIFLPYLVLKRRFAAAAVFAGALAALCILPDLLSALKGSRSDYFENWIAQIVGPALTPGGHSTRFFWQGWMGQTLDNLSLRGVLNRLVREPIAGIAPRHILIAAYVAVIAVIALLMLRSPRRDKFVAVDAAILMIGMLALSPITSRYHFIILMLPYAVVIAASVCDGGIRTLGIWTLAASFILVTGTSNDVTGQALAEFSHAHGFMLIGSLILLVPLAAIIRSGHRRLRPTEEAVASPRPMAARSARAR